MNTLHQISLHISGMNCHSCAKSIETALQKVPGVTKASVNFATEKATIETAIPIAEDLLIAAVAATGYEAHPPDEEHSSHHMHHDGEMEAKLRFIISAILFAPFLLQMFGMFFGLEFPFPSWIQWILASIAQFGVGWNFYRASYLSLRGGSANMDLLIALGTSTAYFFSLVVWIADIPTHLYFESSVAIITLVLLGRWLESTSKGKASAAIRNLLSLQPKTAKVQRGGNFIDLPFEEIVVGDLILVRSGETIAADAVVETGEGEVNESMITGESLPLLKEVGDSVLAGTIITSGSLQVRATNVGAHTMLSHIVKLVEHAQESKAPAQRLADTVSNIFVPAVLLISIVTFLGWLIFIGDMGEAVISAVSVLVIACPCALGLATPIVIVVASGKGASLGIIFKDAAAIELTQKISVLCFDKTGTLTKGEPHLVDTIPAHQLSIQKVLEVAASLESHVQHPIANAIIEAANKENIPLQSVDNFSYQAGKGITGSIGNHSCGVGTIAFARQHKIDIDESLVLSWQQQGLSVNVVWKEEILVGYLTLQDQLRPQAPEAVRQLKQLGVKTAILTGDQELPAQAVAQQANIDTVYAQLLPQDKLDYIQKLKKEGETVGMVGDGINDAPALATADIGMALGASTDVAMETASVILMRNDLNAIVNAIILSKNTVKKIKQNLFFAFIYNILGIPLAAFGLLNPMIAAAAMSLSSLTVVFNALLLNKTYKQQPKK